MTAITRSVLPGFDFVLSFLMFLSFQESAASLGRSGVDSLRLSSSNEPKTDEQPSFRDFPKENSIRFHQLTRPREREALRFAKSFPFVQVRNRDQLLTCVDAPDAITLIFKTTREVKAHPAAVLALILISWWSQTGPPVTSISWLSGKSLGD